MKRILIIALAVAGMAALFSCKKSDTNDDTNALGTYKVDVSEASWNVEGEDGLKRVEIMANEEILKQIQSTKSTEAKTFPYEDIYINLAKGAYHYFEGQNQSILSKHLNGKVKLVWQQADKASNVKVIDTYSYTASMQ